MKGGGVSNLTMYRQKATTMFYEYVLLVNSEKLRQKALKTAAE